MFERYLGIDWSGAGKDAARTRGLAMACEGGVVRPPRYTTWSRVEIEAALRRRLAPAAPRTLVAIDAAFSYPYGFAQAVFGVDRWSAMVEAFAARAAEHASARGLARAINDAFGGATGPYRFDDNRNDNAFYRRHEVPYFRAVELLMPQCLSPFYLGSGATVGFHTITCLATLGRLLRRRAAGEVAFHVWPFEGLRPPADVHVIAECYPAMFPAVGGDGHNPHERDALRVVAWLRQQDWSSGAPLEVSECRVGRRRGLDWPTQLAFEGWVLGV